MNNMLYIMFCIFVVLITINSLILGMAIKMLKDGLNITIESFDERK